MEIATYEDLLAQPAGAVINVADTPTGSGSTQRWTVEGPNWLVDNDGVRIQMSHFQAAVERNLVTLGEPMQAQQLWVTEDGIWHYYVTAQRDDGQWYVTQFYRGTYQGMEWRTDMPDHMRVATMEGELANAIASTSRIIHSNDIAADERNAAARDAVAQAAATGISADRLRRDIGSSIGEYLSEHELDNEDRDDLISVMSAHGVEVSLSRNVNFTIEVSGSSEINGESFDTDTARGYFDPYGNTMVDDIDGTLTVNWTITIEDDDDYEGTGDPCEDREFINDDWVSDHLRNLDISYEDFNIESRSCDCCP